MNETCSCNEKGSCTFCVNQRKLEKNKDKPAKVIKPLKQTPIVKKPVVKKSIDLEVMKGSVVKPKGSSKRIKSEEELELEKKKKAKDKELAKKERDKKRKAIKRELITEKKLDTIFSKWIRSIYPSYCHSTEKPITFTTCHAAHLIGRNNRTVRFDTRNVYPTTPEENMYNSLHVIKLAAKLKHYYNIDIDDWIDFAKKYNSKITSTDRKEMYNVFKDSLIKCDEIKSQLSISDDIKLKQLEDLRNEVILKTKKIM